MKPGVYPGLTMAEYLKLPAVSASVLKAMVDECPLAGWQASYLNETSPAPTAEDDEEAEPTAAKDDTEASDRGSVAHAIFLEGSADCCVVIDPEEHKGKRGGIPRGWTNDAIREARDAARAAGKIPILKPKMARIRAMVAATHAFVQSPPHDDVWSAFQPDGGDSEITIVWDEDGVLCKIRPDRLSADRRLIINYKTTATSVEPNRWARKQFPEHYLGGAFYQLGVRRVFGREADHKFLCQQTLEPFLCSLIGMDPASLALGHAKTQAALRMWRRCVDTGRWEGYPRITCYPELPPWEVVRWEEREIVGVDYERGLASQP